MNRDTGTAGESSDVRGGVPVPAVAMSKDWSTSHARLSADQSTASSKRPNGSRLDRIVPENSSASWGMMAMRSRRSWRPILAMSRPSMVMVPLRKVSTAQVAVGDSRGELDDAEQAEHDGRLARAGPTYDTDLLATLDVDGDAP